MNGIHGRTAVFLGLVFLVALGGRLLFVDHQNMSGDVGLDARAYHQMAVHILAGNGYMQGPPEDPRPGIKRASPLMPVFLAGVYAVFGAHVRYALFVQAVLSASMVVPLFGVTRILSGRDPPAWAAAGAGVFFPDFYAHAGLLLPEMISEWLLVVFVWLAMLYERSERGSWLLAGATAAGLLTLARPQFLPVALVYFGYLILSRGGWFRDRMVPWPHVLAAVLVFVILLTPFTVRNWIKYGEPIFASTTLPCNLLIGNQLQGYGGGFPTDETKAVINRNRKRPLRQRADCRRAVRGLLVNHPGHVVRSMAAKFAMSLTVTRTAAEDPFVEGFIEKLAWQVLIPLIYFPLFVLSVAFMIRSVGAFGTRGPPGRVFVLILVALGLSMLGVFTVMWFHRRYRTLIFVLMIPAAVLEAWERAGEEGFDVRLFSSPSFSVSLALVVGSTLFEVNYHAFFYAINWWNF